MALNLRVRLVCASAVRHNITSRLHVIYLYEQTRGTRVGRRMMPVHHLARLDCQRAIGLRFRSMQATRLGCPRQVDSFLIGIAKLDIPHGAVGKFVKPTAMLANLDAAEDRVWPPCAPTLRTDKGTGSYSYEGEEYASHINSIERFFQFRQVAGCFYEYRTFSVLVSQ